MSQENLPESNILGLHPEAQANFNEKANSLLLLLKAESSPSFEQSSFLPDVVVAATIPIEDIITMTSGKSDPWGNQVAKYFDLEDKRIGLSGEEYQQFVKLCEAVQKSTRRFLSVAFLLDVAFRWMEGKYKNTVTVGFSNFLFQCASEAVAEYEVLIPIAHTFVQSSFQLGALTIKSLDSSFFNEWHASIVQDSPKYEEQISAIEVRRRQLQGSAAASMRVIAEPTRAYEIAYEEVHHSLAMLRFYSRANFFPGIVCYCVPLGEEHAINKTIFTIRMDEAFRVGQQLATSVEPWLITDDEMKLYNESGLPVLHHLLTKEDKSDFEELILDVLVIYSKSSIAYEISDKLLFMFTALETMLLKDQNEPLQQNVAERLAFFTESTVPARRNVIKKYKEAYALRSQYVHHGGKPDSKSATTLQDFFMYVWRFLLLAFVNHKSFKTKSDFIEHIEIRKLS